MFNGRSTEPSLDELFGDAAMRLLMRRDGVTESDIRTLLSTLKDARAVALGATKRGRGAIKSGAHMPECNGYRDCWALAHRAIDE